MPKLSRKQRKQMKTRSRNAQATVDRVNRKPIEVRTALLNKSLVKALPEFSRYRDLIAEEDYK